MFAESLDDRAKLPFDSPFPALLTRDYLTWQSESARLLLEYVSQKPSKLSDDLIKKAFVVGPKKNINKKIKKNRDVNGVECCYCCNIGHVKAEWYKTKPNKGEEDAEKYRAAKAIAILLQQDKPPRYLALTAIHTSYIDSDATAHMMQNKSILKGNAVWSNATIATAGKDTIKAKTENDTTVKISGVQESIGWAEG